MYVYILGVNIPSSFRSSSSCLTSCFCSCFSCSSIVSSTSISSSSSAANSSSSGCKSTMSLVVRKPVFRVSGQQQMARGLKFRGKEVEGLYYYLYIAKTNALIIFFLFSLTSLSRLFHSYRDEPIGGWGETGVPRENHLTHPQAELGLSHMWPVRGLNQHQSQR